MFNKEIEFSAHEDYFALKEDYPTPIKLNIPEWYKKLEHSILNKTIKGCMPFLDTLTSGYLLKMPQDFNVRHNVDNKNEKGEKVEQTEWHKVVAWGKTAEIIEKYVTKGKEIAIEGKLTHKIGRAHV